MPRAAIPSGTRLPPHVSRRAFLPLAFLLALSAILIRVSGGIVFTVGAWRLSARRPEAAALAASVALGLWLVTAWRRRAVADDLRAASAWVDAHAWALIACPSAVAVALVLAFGTFSATGSDASGYLSEAAMLSASRLTHREPLAAIAVWDGGPSTVAPYGWQAAGGDEQVPTYAPGLPLLMAVPHQLGGSIAACLVGALAAGVAVWAAAGIATLSGSPTAGLLAAAALLVSPTFLAQALQPMSDVPATAAWLMCWLGLMRASTERNGQGLRIALAGMSAAMAVLIRPNLAPLAALPLGYVLSWPGESWRWRATRAIVFSSPVAIAGVVVAALQWRWYGSPLMSGYGAAADLYAWSHVPLNASRYSSWTASFESPLLLLAPLAGVKPRARGARWLLVFAAGVVFAYVLYLVVEQWTYVRFLLPAIAIALTLSAAVIASVGQRRPWASAPIAAGLVLIVVAHGLSEARALGIFQSRSLHARAVLAGRYLEPLLPRNAVVIAGEQTGSVRYYTGRSTVRWELLANDRLGSVIATLQAAGRDVWIALDVWEEERFRARFRDHPAGGLDWPPAVDAGTASHTRAWRVADRAPFMAGARLHTDRLR